MSLHLCWHLQQDRAGKGASLASKGGSLALGVCLLLSLVRQNSLRAATQTLPEW